MQSAPVLQSRLKELRRLIRLALGLAAAGKLASVLFSLSAVSFLLDITLHFTLPQRAFLLIVTTAIFVWLLLKDLILPLTRRLGEDDLAMQVEKRWPGPRDLLVSALEFALQPDREGGTSPELRETVVARADEAAEGIEPARLIRWAKVRRSVALGCVCLLAAGLFTAARPGMAGLWAERNILLGAAHWPRRTQLSLVGFEGTRKFVPQGEDVEVTVRASGRVPRMATLNLKFRKSGATRSITMNKLGPDTFVAKLPGLTESCAFTVAAGDGVIEEHVLELVARPLVLAAEVTVEPPAYTGLAATKLEWNAPALKVPGSSKVGFRVSANKDIGSAMLTLDGRDKVGMELESARMARHTFVVQQNVECSLMMTDTLGVSMAEPLPLRLEAIPDAPPALSLTAHGVGERITPAARIPLLIKASDDYGLAGVWLEAGYTGRSGRRELAKTALLGSEVVTNSLEADYALDIQNMGLPSEGSITCTVVANDRCTVPAPNTARSEPATFRLVTVQELLADLLVRQQDARQDIEHQINRQNALLGTARKAFEAPWAKGAGWSESGTDERALGSALQSIAEVYRRILSEMLNNRVIKPPVFEDRMADIVGPLELIAGPGGRLSEVADALERIGEGGPGSREDPERVLAGMQTVLRVAEGVRGNMMLLETFTQVASSVEEIAEKQKLILERTAASYDALVKELLGKQE